jgi:hypothetical protein
LRSIWESPQWRLPAASLRQRHAVYSWRVLLAALRADPGSWLAIDLPPERADLGAATVAATHDRRWVVRLGLSLGLGGGDAAHLVPEAEPVGAVDVAGELDWL